MTIHIKSRRLLIILAAAFALIALVLVATIAQLMSEAQRQSKIVARIHSLRGAAYYDFQTGKPEHSLWPLRHLLGDELLGTVVEVYLHDCHVTDDDISMLRELPSIRSLSLLDTQIGDDALRHISQLKQIEFLWLDGTRITDQGIQALTPLQCLKELRIEKTSITDGAAPYIAQLRGLRKLAMGNTKIGDAGVAQFAGLQLQSIKLASTSITDASGRVLAGFGQLVELDVAHTYVSDAFFSSGSNWPSLEVLRIDNTEITDVSVPVISRLKALNRLGIYRTPMTKAGASKLQQALPDCIIFD